MKTKTLKLRGNPAQNRRWTGAVKHGWDQLWHAYYEDDRTEGHPGGLVHTDSYVRVIESDAADIMRWLLSGDATEEDFPEEVDEGRYTPSARWATVICPWLNDREVECMSDELENLEGGLGRDATAGEFLGHMLEECDPPERSAIQKWGIPMLSHRSPGGLADEMAGPHPTNPSALGRLLHLWDVLGAMDSKREIPDAGFLGRLYNGDASVGGGTPLPSGPYPDAEEILGGRIARRNSALMLINSMIRLFYLSPDRISALIHLPPIEKPDERR